MIYYFSGTGNSEWVAKQLGKQLEDRIVNIADSKSCKSIGLSKGEAVGFVFPIYAWDTPPFVMEFIQTLKLDEDTYIYAVCTCESEQGHALKKLNKMLGLRGAYTVLMPNNYTIMTKAENKESVKKKIEAAREQIIGISENIKNRKDVLEFKHANLGVVKTNLVAPMFHAFTKNSWKKFWVQDTCNGCTLCEKNCPKHCIAMKDNKPVWSSGCIQCLSCFNRCPKTAIQYGKSTVNKERYYMKERD